MIFPRIANREVFADLTENEWSACRSRHSTSKMQPEFKVLDLVARLFGSVAQIFRPVGVQVRSFQC